MRFWIRALGAKAGGCSADAGNMATQHALNVVTASMIMSLFFNSITVWASSAVWH